MAGGDITKYDDIYKINYILCLNKLSYEIEKEKLIEGIQNRNIQLQKNKRK